MKSSTKVHKQSNSMPQGHSVLRNAMAMPHAWIRENGKLTLVIRFQPQITKRTKNATYFKPESIRVVPFCSVAI